MESLTDAGFMVLVVLLVRGISYKTTVRLLYFSFQEAIFQEANRMQLHEDFRRGGHGVGGSDRGFGLVFAVFFFLAGVLPLRKGLPVRTPALVLSGLFLVLSLAYPRILHPLNRVWTLFGLLLSRITTPIITTIMFSVLFVPAGMILRLLGKDLLRLRHDAAVPSYWIERQPPGPAAGSMADQF